MQECIELAKKSPYNLRMPHTGALVVSNSGEIISKGYKQFLDGTIHTTIHAERDAINHAGEYANGQCLVTTLEPCYRERWKGMLFDCCCDLIINSGIKTVIYGVKDDSPTVHSGCGIRYLKSHRIETINFDEFNEEIVERFMPLMHNKNQHNYTPIESFPNFKSYVNS